MSHEDTCLLSVAFCVEGCSPSRWQCLFITVCAYWSSRRRLCGVIEASTVICFRECLKWRKTYIGQWLSHIIPTAVSNCTAASQLSHVTSYVVRVHEACDYQNKENPLFVSSSRYLDFPKYKLFLSKIFLSVLEDFRKTAGVLTFYYLDNIFTQSDVYYWQREELTGIEMILILKDSSFQDVDVPSYSPVSDTFHESQVR